MTGERGKIKSVCVWEHENKRGREKDKAGRERDKEHKRSKERTVKE